MKISEELTTQSEHLLQQLDLKLVSETEEGMVKAIEWHNDQARLFYSTTEDMLKRLLLLNQSLLSALI